MSLTAAVLERLSPEQLAAKSKAELWTIAHLDDLDEAYAAIPSEEADAMRFDWSWWQRPAQKVPGAMGRRLRMWMVRAGRGYGKTRTGAETTRLMSDKASRLALVGATAADVRDVMIEGESGIMECFPNGEKPDYTPSKRRIVFPSGCIGTCYSAEEPDRLRGPQHEWAWGDEPASWRYGQQAIDNLRFGLRLGKFPWFMLTGTPKPTPWLREMTAADDAVTTTGSTYENTGNLAPGFIADILGRYEGTRLGRQEIHAEWLDDVEGALWSQANLHDNRVSSYNHDNPWRTLNEWLGQHHRARLLDRRPWRTIVAVDPPGSTAECGIIVASAPVNAIQGRDHAFILADESMRGRPEDWGAQVVKAARLHGRGGQPLVVYVEDNQGGEMVRSTIHAVDPNVTVNKVHASESKYARAEPISALDAKGWIHHVGFFPALESQMVTWVPTDEKSPDRIDARVHALRELMTVLEVAPSRVWSPTRARRR